MVITGLPTLPHIWYLHLHFYFYFYFSFVNYPFKFLRVSRIQYLLSELLLKRIGKVSFCSYFVLFCFILFYLFFLKVSSIHIPVISTQSETNSMSTSHIIKGVAFVELSRVSEAWLVYEALDGFCWPTGMYVETNFEFFFSS